MAVFEDETIEKSVERLIQTDKRPAWELSLEIEGAPEELDVLAKDLSYEPITINVEGLNYGSQQVSKPRATERTTLVVTVRDTKDKRLYNWCRRWAEATVHSDGTFGLPEHYVKKVTIYSTSNKVYDPSPTSYQMMLTNVGAINPDRNARDQYLEFPITLTQYKTA